MRFLIDIDGTLYDGSHRIEGAAEAIHFLEQQQFPFLLVTNTTRLRRTDIASRLRADGIEVPVERIFAAPQAACDYLRARRPGGRCFVIGPPVMDEALRAAGLSAVRTEQPVDFVVVSQYQWIDFGELDIAQRLIRAGAEPVSLHRDLVYPEDGVARISLGAVVAALEAVTGRAVTVIGKPNPAFFAAALAYAGFQAADTVMIGDNFEADIRGAVGAGLRAIQVRTGSFGSLPGEPGVALAELDSIAALPAWLQGGAG